MCVFSNKVFIFSAWYIRKFKGELRMVKEKNVLSKVFEEDFTLLSDEERKDFIFECLLGDDFSIFMNSFALKNRLDVVVVRICREYAQTEKAVFSEEEIYDRLYSLREKEIAYFSSIGFVSSSEDCYRGRDVSKDFMNCVKRLGYSPEEFSKEIEEYEKRRMKKKIEKK